jgi:zinc protease
MKFDREFNFVKYKLSNGFNVILYQDKSTPLVATNLYYNVGSYRDPQNKTGIAHLFEHLMFEGSKNVKKGEHFKFIEDLGGGLNAFTSFDKTVYYEFIPADYLELILFLEADRMFNLLDGLNEENLKNQIDVVYNERLERYDNTPYGLTFENILFNIYPKTHPYAHPVIGSADDIKSYTLNDVKEFYQKYYHPANASLVVAGNFDFDTAKKLIEQYFDKNIITLPSEQIQIENFEINKTFEKRIYDNVQFPLVNMTFKASRYDERDSIVLSMFSEVLSSYNNSYLNKKYYFEEQSVLNISSYNLALKHDGIFFVQFLPKSIESIDKLIENVYTDILNIRNNLPDDFMLQKIKNSNFSNFIFSLQSISDVANQINEYEFYYNDPDYFKKTIEIYNSITNDDIVYIIEKYFQNKNYFILKVFPKSEAENA